MKLKEPGQSIMKRHGITGALLLILAAAGANAVAASFDCTQARTSAEKIVCGDPELSGLDQDMADQFRRAVAMNPDVRKQQSDWLRTTREQCPDVACMTSAYR